MTVSIQPLLQITGMVSIGIVDNGEPVAQDIMDALLNSKLSTTIFGDEIGLPMVRRMRIYQ